MVGELFIHRRLQIILNNNNNGGQQAPTSAVTLPPNALCMHITPLLNTIHYLDGARTAGGGGMVPTTGDDIIGGTIGITFTGAVVVFAPIMAGLLSSSLLHLNAINEMKQNNWVKVQNPLFDILEFEL